MLCHASSVSCIVDILGPLFASSKLLSAIYGREIIFLPHVYCTYACSILAIAHAFCIVYIDSFSNDSSWCICIDGKTSCYIHSVINKSFLFTLSTIISFLTHPDTFTRRHRTLIRRTRLNILHRFESRSNLQKYRTNNLIFLWHLICRTSFLHPLPPQHFFDSVLLLTRLHRQQITRL